MSKITSEIEGCSGTGALTRSSFLGIISCLPFSCGERGKHFVLVHGACHGAWCWYKVATLLRSSGHNVTTIDLAASGINPIQASSLLSISDYFKPLRDVMEERYPKKIAVAVFVIALMPGPILNITMVYAEDWTLANTLMRPQRLFNDEDMTREITLSEQNYGSVRRVAVISEDDKLIDKDFMLWMIERNPPDQVLEVKGSDHMVMMSKPMRLLALLQHIANITHY
ncbi:salicylic acid-binding protein 2 [Eucalyptus grandis]|uniref:salicylic acid-binding protein 2 n=1 Tax=Eucalyptus grandis TaxID=71139 RepID=UPI00192EBD7C|nr:salicylic acid-binding protein 2 [Eucalyptus grandis]